MFMFIWKRVQKCTDHWHPEGGVVVFANTVEHARELANAEEGCKIDEFENPTVVKALAEETDPAVFIFPDAGCC
jgi:hypothetical protein